MCLYQIIGNKSYSWTLLDHGELNDFCTEDYWIYTSKMDIMIVVHSLLHMLQHSALQNNLGSSSLIKAKFISRLKSIMLLNSPIILSGNSF